MKFLLEVRRQVRTASYDICVGVAIVTAEPDCLVKSVGTGCGGAEDNFLIVFPHNGCRLCTIAQNELAS
jgi:hypothetical protein